ncbi:MAG: S-layer homology domain-containing protein [Clostridia bacterium]|nr:S-layer homology domain-containing protein [Clostridia bacterium]
MKRKFSLLMAAACLFSSLTFGGVAHADTPSSFTDVTNKTQYYEGIMTLTKLGIINGYTEDNGATYSFKPEGEITRAEFSKIIITALGAEASVGNSDKFTDIDSHWAKGFIIAAADRGIVNGMGDGTFAPDAKVTYEQAVKMIVCAAGYETQAQALGGWPNGYLAQADNLGIRKDAVSADTTAPASRGIIAQLMYNVLEVDVPEYDINGSLKKELDTFMETYLGIVKEKATIVGVEDKVLASFDGTLYLDEMAIMLKNDDIVTMDYTTYVTDKSVIEERLGQEVVIYYRIGKNGGANTLYAMDFETTKNTVTVISSEDVEQFSGATLKYYDSNDKLRTFTIDASVASVYYNGKLAGSASDVLDTYLDPDLDTFMYGEVKLTDSGSDRSIDIVEITDYEYVVVAKTPSTSDYVVSNKVKFASGSEPVGYIGSIALDPDSVEYDVNITNASGTAVSPTSLKANDVLLVAQSEDAQIRTVKVCSSPVTGKIVGKSTADNTVTINSKDYKISAFAAQYFEDNGISTDIAAQGTFYVDMYDYIVFATQSAIAQSTSPYAYIIRASIDDTDETQGTIRAYIPSTSRVETYNISGKIRYNGSNVAVATVIEKLQNNVSSESEVVVPDAYNSDIYDGGEPTTTNASQVARITVNGSALEEIIVVEPDYEYAEEDEDNRTEDTMTIKPYKELAETEYTGSNNFGGEFYVNSSTTFIYVPQDRSDTNLYAKKSISSFKTGTDYWVQPYNVNSSKYANLVLIYGSETQTINVKSEAQAWLMASDHNTTIDDDEQIYEVSYYSNSATATEKTASVDKNLIAGADYDTTDMGDIGIGDFFRAGTDSSSGLVNAQLLLKYDDVMDAISGNCDFTGLGWSNTYGEIKVVNVIEVSEDNGNYSLRVTKDGFDENGKISTTNEDLISIGSSVIIYRISDDGSMVTPYLEGTQDRITAADFGEAEFEGTKASKIAIYSYRATTGVSKAPKMILIYE